MACFCNDVYDDNGIDFQNEFGHNNLGLGFDNGIGFGNFGDYSFESGSHGCEFENGFGRQHLGFGFDNGLGNFGDYSSVLNHGFDFNLGQNYQGYDCGLF